LSRTESDKTKAFDNFKLLAFVPETIQAMSNGLDATAHILSTLPALGVGTGAAIKKATNAAFLNITAAEQDAAAKQSYIIIAGVMLILIVFTYIMLKR
jgi:Flp pilus assembly protein TadB